MKPRNTQERELQRMHESLPALTMAQMNWILGQDCEYCLKEHAKTKRMVCGNNYYAVITTHKGWQVSRYYLIQSRTTKNGYAMQSLTEVSQRWMQVDENGKMQLYIYELPKLMCWQWMSQPYSLSAPLSLKPWSAGWNRSGRTYFSMADYQICPNRRFAKAIVDAGLAKGFGRCDEIELYKDAEHQLKDIKGLRLSKKGLQKAQKRCYLPSITETLFKTGEKALAQLSMSKTAYAGMIRQYWQSFLVAKRHGLRMKDWQMWLDYVHDLDTLGKDIHSPKYLVPADLGKAHAKTTEKLAKIRKAQLAEMERARIAKEESAYAKRIQPYLSLVIVTKKSHLSIAPLPSVQAFYEEGEAMHHCVYNGGYYKRDDSLILSAKDESGNRVETIEINTKTLQIIQSRGVCNQYSPFHKEIVKTMEANMWQIENVATRQRMAC